MKLRTRTIVIAALAVAVSLALVVGGVVWFNRPAPTPPADSERLRAAVTSDHLMDHLDALQAIADAHGGNRQAGTPGHEASVDYVEEQLRAAGYTTRRQEFTYERPDFTKASLATTNSADALEVGRDFRPLAYSGAGSVTAVATPVDVNLAGDRATSGCEESDFATFPRGTIALLQRGTCYFEIKVDHAIAAGASGVVLFNQGNTDENRGLFSGTLSEPTRAIPVLAVTHDLGARWATTPTTLTLSVDSTSTTVTTENLLADTAGDAGRTIVVGAHLDGVDDGPGINDNGSGVAAVLETAVQFAEVGVRPTARVRFAFWSGEEDGLYGSQHYVDQLDEAGRRATDLYLNVDMVGSPNPVPAVYGGGGLAAQWPAGSRTIQGVLTDFLATQGVRPETVSFDSSDHAPFAGAGVPVGGLFTGADEAKSATQAERYGGAADAPADPCYHLSCDVVGAVDADVLGLMADALAHATLTLAQAPARVG